LLITVSTTVIAAKYALGYPVVPTKVLVYIPDAMSRCLLDGQSQNVLIKEWMVVVRIGVDQIDAHGLPNR
jgi:hypothetical protein